MICPVQMMFAPTHKKGYAANTLFAPSQQDNVFVACANAQSPNATNPSTCFLANAPRWNSLLFPPAQPHRTAQSQGAVWRM